MPFIQPSAVEELAHRELTGCKVDYFSHTWTLRETHATQRLVWGRRDLLTASGYSCATQRRCENLLWRLQHHLSHSPPSSVPPAARPRIHAQWRNRFEKHNAPLIGPIHAGLTDDPDDPANRPKAEAKAKPPVFAIGSLLPDSGESTSTSAESSIPSSPTASSATLLSHASHAHSSSLLHAPLCLTTATRQLYHPTKPSLKKSTSNLCLSIGETCRGRLKLGHLDLGGHVSARQFAQVDQSDPWSSYLPLSPRSPRQAEAPGRGRGATIGVESQGSRLTFCPTVERRIITEESETEGEGGIASTTAQIHGVHLRPPPISISTPSSPTSSSLSSASSYASFASAKSSFAPHSGGWGMRMDTPARLRFADEGHDHDDEDDEDEEEDRPFYHYDSPSTVRMDDYFGIRWDGEDPTDSLMEGQLKEGFLPLSAAAAAAAATVTATTTSLPPPKEGWEVDDTEIRAMNPTATHLSLSSSHSTLRIRRLGSDGRRRRGGRMPPQEGGESSGWGTEGEDGASGGDAGGPAIHELPFHGLGWILGRVSETVDLFYWTAGLRFAGY